MSERIRELLAAMTVPPALDEVLRAAEGPGVEAGHIWQTRWDDLTALVLVVEMAAAGDAGVIADVVAVTLSNTAPTGSRVPTLSLETDALPVATVWPQTLTRLPARVFERMLVPSSQTTGVTEAVRAQRDHSVDIDIFDPGLDIAAELSDTLEALAEAPGLPVQVSSGSPFAARMQGDTPGKLRVLSEVLGVSPQGAHALLRGKARPTAEQVMALVAAGVLPAGVALAEAFPPEDVAELEHPRFKAEILSIAERRGISEAEVRILAAREAYALAARITGTADPAGVRVRHALARLR